MRHAAREIREAIISGRLDPGARLVEQDLARTLNLSRGPVREALRELSREGLVELRPNRGATVTRITPDNVVEVYAIRNALGSLVLRVLLIDGPPAPETLARLESLAARARAAAKRSQAAMIEADLAFQRALVEETGLPRLVRQFVESSAEIRTFVSRLRIEYPDRDRILEDHDRLIEALRRCDLAAAERTWRGRFRRSAQEFLSMLPDADEPKPSTRALLAALSA
jgi:DNA-binding GntR family transcriptional regulator